MDKIYQENDQYTIIVLKLLLVINEYVRNGPDRVFKIPETNQYGNQDILCYILDKVIKTWTDIAKMNIKNSEDQARCSLYSYTIILFAYILHHKIKFGRKYVHSLLGNFSLEPYYESRNSNR